MLNETLVTTYRADVYRLHFVNDRVVVAYRRPCHGEGKPWTQLSYNDLPFLLQAKVDAHVAGVLVIPNEA